MKKILFVYHVSSIGGGSYCLLNILKSLDRTVVKPYVLLCNNGPLVDEIRKLHIDVHFLPEMRTVPYNSSTLTISALLNAYHIIHSFKVFKDLVSKLDVDAVYLNTMMLYPYLRQTKELGKKAIIHSREHWPKGEHKWQRNQAIQHIKTYADHIVAINSYSASMMEERSKEVAVVYDWIDMKSRFDICPLSDIFNEDMSDKKVFLYTGGVQRIKGAVEVLSAFSKSIKDKQSRLLVFGINPECEISFLKRCLCYIGLKSYYCQVKELIKKDNRIVCIPITYNLSHIMQQCYCNLSYFTIPHANLALAECVIMGTPSVAVRTEESMEYSLNGELSLLFEINNKEDFHKTILCLNDRYDQIKKALSDKSILIEQMFSPSANIKKLNYLLKLM